MGGSTARFTANQFFLEDNAQSRQRHALYHQLEDDKYRRISSYRRVLAYRSSHDRPGFAPAPVCLSLRRNAMPLRFADWADLRSGSLTVAWVLTEDSWRSDQYGVLESKSWDFRSMIHTRESKIWDSCKLKETESKKSPRVQYCAAVPACRAVTDPSPDDIIGSLDERHRAMFCLFRCPGTFYSFVNLIPQDFRYGKLGKHCWSHLCVTREHGAQLPKREITTLL